MTIEPHVQAIMLLTVTFSGSNTSEVKPLSGSEWAKFAIWLKDHKLEPSSLLAGNLGDQLSGWSDSKITLPRLEMLLQRGGALAVVLEKWQRAGLWVFAQKTFVRRPDWRIWASLHSGSCEDMQPLPPKSYGKVSDCNQSSARLPVGPVWPRDGESKANRSPQGPLQNPSGVFFHILESKLKPREQLFPQPSVPPPQYTESCMIMSRVYPYHESPLNTLRENRKSETEILEPTPRKKTLTLSPYCKASPSLEAIQPRHFAKRNAFIYFIKHVHTFGFFASRESLIRSSSKTKKN